MGTKNLIFDFEPFLTEKLQIQLAPKVKNLKEKAEVKALVVCKHWLRGLCKKGDRCEFLHEYNLKKMPECWFFTKYNECSNPECQYLHIDPSKKIVECLWYARGFCKHGPMCRNSHLKKAACQLYISGFCPDGPNCNLSHPSFEIPAPKQ